MYGLFSFVLPGDADVTAFGSGIYDMDVQRVVTDFASRRRGYRTSVHPLQKILVAPLGLALDGLVFGGASALGAAKLLVVAATWLQALLVGWLVVRWTGGAIWAAAAAAWVFGASFSSVLAASLPESAALAGLGTTAPLVWLEVRRDRRASAVEACVWIALGVVAIGLTLTQVVPWGIALVARGWNLASGGGIDRRGLVGRGAAVVAGVAVLLVAGAHLQSAAFPGTEPFYRENPLASERHFFRTANLELAPAPHGARLLAHFAVYDFVAPLPAYSDFLIRDYGLDYWSLSIEEAGLAQWTTAQLALALAVLVATAFALAGLRRAGSRCVPALLCVGAMFALHLVFGREYVLYSPTWHGAWVAVLVASAWNAARARGVVLAACGLLGIGMLVNDAVVLRATYREVAAGLSIELRDTQGRILDATGGD